MDYENLGLIDEEPREADHVLGSENLAGEVWDKILTENKEGVIDWRQFPISEELQRKNKRDTNACVSFSGNKWVQYPMKYFQWKKAFLICSLWLWKFQDQQLLLLPFFYRAKKVCNFFQTIGLLIIIQLK